MNLSHDDHIDSVDYSVGSTPTLISSPLSPIHHRSGYRPIAALPQEDTAYAGAQTRPDRDMVGGSYRARAENHGLAIENLDTQPIVSISRVPVGGRSPRVVSMGADSLLSPSSTRLGRDSSQSLNKEFEDEMGDLGRSRSTSRLYQPFMADSELEDLNKRNPADTIRSSDSPSMWP